MTKKLNREGTSAALPFFYSFLLIIFSREDTRRHAKTREKKLRKTVAYFSQITYNIHYYFFLCIITALLSAFASLRAITALLSAFAAKIK